MLGGVKANTIVEARCHDESGNGYDVWSVSDWWKVGMRGQGNGEKRGVQILLATSVITFSFLPLYSLTPYVHAACGPPSTLLWLSWDNAPPACYWHREGQVVARMTALQTSGSGSAPELSILDRVKLGKMWRRDGRVVKAMDLKSIGDSPPSLITAIGHVAEMEKPKGADLRPLTDDDNSMLLFDL
ncbi:unnamed protein product [Hydatigera taeniaeformis]|uniref:Transducin/WD40 repeat-like superfamily protein n=1 Tax=Hydatigena taeniaeformis TaxID=6205 RepID=A0A0R3WSM5_HYDTA|nr:unnamed protein product [Hydatigera taeniaeformis]